MGESEKKERRFSQEQYDMLKRCSKKKDMTEWNEWRVNNPEKDILLKGAELNEFYLKDAFLNKGEVEWDNKEYDFTGEVYLKGAWLDDAHLENADLWGVHLENAHLVGAHLEDADLGCAHLENAYLWDVYLESARLWDAHLENAFLWRAHLENVNFERATVDGKTLVWDCKLDRMTNFQSVGLDSVRIDPQTKQLLEYNIRRMNWEEWYKGHWFWRWPVRAFWAMSDYGMSTLRVVGVFFILALLFAAVYVNWAYWAPPGIISNLIVRPEIGEEVWHYFSRALIRPIYFSIVTMTTLGFGDMYANKGSIAGHVLLIFQVILGYVLLGALVTRFAVLFTAGGPAGKFAEEKK